MIDFLKNLFTADFMPHGHCYFWKPEILWLHVASDIVITLAYYSIPLTLFYFITKRKDVPFRWIFVLFATFIFACGTTHIMAVWTTWNGAYRLEGVVKALTALVSIATAFAIWPFLPDALSFPNPAQLKAIKNEAQLKRSEMRFRMTFEAAPNGMIMVDDEGKIILANSQIEKMFGYEKEELVGRSIDMMVPQRFRARHPEYRRDFFQDPQTRAMGAGRDLFGRRKDGSEFPVEIGLNPMETDEGAFVISSVVDITERKHTEEQVRRANEELQRVNQMKSSFVSMVSHELRTPLSSMKSGIDILLDGIDGPINEGQRETLTITKRNIDRLARLINNVLDYSRLEAGKMQMVFERADMAEVVREACEVMKPDIAGKQIQFTLELPDRPLYAVCDADKIKQVMINLLSNAVKFTDQKGKIHVALASSKEQITIEVEDDGVGINPEDHQKIFEMFGQATQRGVWKTGGSGVGLAVCRLILQNHGGTITAKSEPGKGALFTATFRADLPASPSKGPKVSSS